MDLKEDAEPVPPPAGGRVMIEGQLNPTEREVLRQAALAALGRPLNILEVGTWLGGGSTLQFLRALAQLGTGHLWGIEADLGIGQRMMENLRAAAPETLHRFTPLFGYSHKVIPKWLGERGPDFRLQVVFLDGGDNPGEQIREFHLVDPRMPVGAMLLAHDAHHRKGKWLVPYLRELDHWEAELVEGSDVGLLRARKRALHPSSGSLRRARAGLIRRRLQPVELAAALLPRAVCGLVLKCLPSGVVRKLMGAG